MKAVIKLLLFFWMLVTGFSNPCTAISAPSGTATEHITVRRPPAEKISKFQHDKNFNYVENAHTKDNSWERILNWIWRHLFSRKIDSKYSPIDIILSIIEWVIIAAAVVLFIYFILKSQGVNLFSKKSGNNLSFTETTEDISQMNFDELIARAAGNGQYRQAVRYLYLKSLKQLSDLDLIKWKTDKTNRDYTIELRSSPFAKLFSEITMLFDYAWYGNARISETAFSKIKTAFEQFNSQTGLRN
jgi:hypothetical protein